MLSNMVTQRRKIEEKVVIKWSMSNKGFVKGQLGCNCGQEVKNKWKMGICVIVMDHGEGVFGDFDSPQDIIMDPTVAEVAECGTKSEYSLGCTDTEEGRKKLV